VQLKEDKNRGESIYMSWNRHLMNYTKEGVVAIKLLEYKIKKAAF